MDRCAWWAFVWDGMNSLKEAGLTDSGQYHCKTRQDKTRQKNTEWDKFKHKIFYGWPIEVMISSWTSSWRFLLWLFRVLLQTYLLVCFYCRQFVLWEPEILSAAAEFVAQFIFSIYLVQSFWNRQWLSLLNCHCKIEIFVKYIVKSVQ